MFLTPCAYLLCCQVVQCTMLHIITTSCSYLGRYRRNPNPLTVPEPSDIHATLPKARYSLFQARHTPALQQPCLFGILVSIFSFCDPESSFRLLLKRKRPCSPPAYLTWSVRSERDLRRRLTLATGYGEDRLTTN
ncbi:hypothetical protein HDV57DRAFT_370448 [Trichoderma longibrachiatum]|uniref:Secreted protein n=1 Tax=Trichoderma longibrachiatum ATCC 18648 TaxID=983965 RepID=A0A2T4BXT4_TRILO|nr:hypothetical protein M440DRAFT_1058805 [Trichoderma longibrachiatum ATCC 18648]